MKYLENFINMISTEKIIAVFAILLVVLAISCDPKQFQDKEELPRVEGYEKVVVIDGCEYIEYKATFYCGHQYNHHEYKSNLLTHKGNCKNHSGMK